MHISLQLAGVLVAGQSLLTGVLGDFSGPSFPPPRDLTTDQSLVKTAWESVTAALDAHLDSPNGNSSFIPQEAQNITFSIGLFSIHDPSAISLQFHHTSPEIAASTQGTNQVDENSIYRVASVTKVFTVLAGLLTLSDAEWERPLSDILAPLSSPGGSSHGTGVLSTPWDKISMRALAAQIAGVPRDGFPNLGEIALQMVLANKTEASIMEATGLPPASALENDPLVFPPCLLPILQGQACTEVPYVQGVANRAPTFSPWASPAYSNNGFILLGLAMAKVTNQTMSKLYQDNILDPLSMISTFSDPPPTTLYPRSVIVGDASSFSIPNGIFVSSGGVFSTTSDLARLGSGILNSTLLLSPERTRRWLKPVSHTARLEYSVGAPWEIMRFRHARSGKVTDLYTKLGDSGNYSSWLVLMPEYGFGFSILSAGSASGRFGVVAALADRVTQAMVPALQRQAAVEAGRNFEGTYRYDGPGRLNSTLVLKTDTEDDTPGLVISSWVSNGTDVLPFLTQITGPGPHRLLPSVELDNGQVAFRLVGARDSTATGGSEALFAGPGMMTADWLVVDDTTYYGAGVSLFVFDVRRDGKATGVTIPAYRVTLSRSTY